MRFPLFPALVLLVVNGLVDWYIYRVVREAFRRPFFRRLQLVSAVLLAAVIIVVVCLPKRNGSDGSLVGIMWVLYAYLTVYVPKYLFVFFSLFSKIPRLWGGRKWGALSVVGVVVGVVAFVAMWWGALINRFDIQVNRVEVPVHGLPPAFDGLSIAQISDLHVGTFGSDTTFVSELVDSVNALHPDVIVFTGDFVNRRSDEFKPFVSVLSRLHAPLGVYSVMGNHDYGDYSDWDSPADKEADVRAIKGLQRDAGFTMLNNSTAWLRVGNDSIALIGVENIGDPPFKVYGDLRSAYPDISDSKVKILLSHNPAHWENEIEDKATNVALTLAGHTHAMQMELLGWSPAALRYDKWAGLYTDSSDQKLYVNIGAGTVGMPYRIGAAPEITLLSLSPSK